MDLRRAGTTLSGEALALMPLTSVCYDTSTGAVQNVQGRPTRAVARLRYPVFSDHPPGGPQHNTQSCSCPLQPVGGTYICCGKMKCPLFRLGADQMLLG